MFGYLVCIAQGKSWACRCTLHWLWTVLAQVRGNTKIMIFLCFWIF